MPILRQVSSITTLVKHPIAFFLIGGHLLFSVSPFIALSTIFHPKVNSKLICKNIKMRCVP